MDFVIRFLFSDLLIQKFKKRKYIFLPSGILFLLSDVNFAILPVTEFGLQLTPTKTLTLQKNCFIYI